MLSYKLTTDISIYLLLNDFETRSIPHFTVIVVPVLFQWPTAACDQRFFVFSRRSEQWSKHGQKEIVIFSYKRQNDVILKTAAYVRSNKCNKKMRVLCEPIAVDSEVFRSPLPYHHWT